MKVEYRGKYANFIKGKVYEATARGKIAGTKTHTNWKIEDEDGDLYEVASGDIYTTLKKDWVLIEEG